MRERNKTYSRRNRRQLYLAKLTQEYGSPKERIELEYPVKFGREVKRADIGIFDKDRPTVPYIIVELKRQKLKDGTEQLKSYCNATGAPIGVWTNGGSISFYNRTDPNYFEDIPNIPKASEKLSDILTERWKIEDLIRKDKLMNERKSLKDLTLAMEDEVLANAGVDVFEEVSKLIFTKLYDEMESGRKKDRNLGFRNYGYTETELKDKLESLFTEAREKWQHFTPRSVIDMCVHMLNPTENETMIDTVAGRCGFPVHTIFYVWQKILESKGLKRSHLFTLETKPAECTDYVQSKVFAIDFEANINQAIAILRFDESMAKHLYRIQFFNSNTGQLLIEKYARQGLQANLNLEELSNLYLPVLPMQAQALIAEKVRRSFALRSESKRLLERTKQPVEAEIEKERFF